MGRGIPIRLWQLDYPDGFAARLTGKMCQAMKTVNEYENQLQNQADVSAWDPVGSSHPLNRARVRNAVKASLLILWVLPNTLIGLVVGILGVLTGGGVGRTGRALEFWGAFTGFFLRFFPAFARVSSDDSWACDPVSLRGASRADP